MARQIALLRGINLGSRNRLGMVDLRRILHELGYEDARTLWQSGNAVFTSSEPPDEVASRIEQALAREVGLEVPVLVRSRDELARVVARNPLGDVADDLKRYLVIFLSDKADRKLVAGVEAAAYEPERFAVHGREVYVWLPVGVHGARLTQNFWERRLRVTATMRNWNTVEKLLALADS